MNREEISSRITEIITNNEWLDRVDAVSFLAAGEYNEKLSYQCRPAKICLSHQSWHPTEPGRSDSV